ncbi:MAG TPA: hypothetical protein PLP61_00275 [Nocardioides sp.]|uniref:hypothetical protein n=1 Tax=Nocardioides sp. TaxID=35761 RepID=UPI002BED59E0|nr:hypothetical protein [Nocardioides sp.]HQR25448.1 hypothetical protein [Nocardioides sp.]
MTTGGAVYAINVRGHLDDHWAGWLGGLTLTHHDDGTTTLTGPVVDQADLHGVLAKLRDGGITLIALSPINPPAKPDLSGEKE